MQSSDMCIILPLYAQKQHSATSKYAEEIIYVIKKQIWNLSSKQLLLGSNQSVWFAIEVKYRRICQVCHVLSHQTKQRG